MAKEAAEVNSRLAISQSPRIAVMNLARWVSCGSLATRPIVLANTSAIFQLLVPIVSVSEGRISRGTLFSQIFTSALSSFQVVYHEAGVECGAKCAQGNGIGGKRGLLVQFGICHPLSDTLSMISALPKNMRNGSAEASESGLFSSAPLGPPVDALDPSIT